MTKYFLGFHKDPTNLLLVWSKILIILIIFYVNQDGTVARDHGRFCSHIRQNPLVFLNKSRGIEWSEIQLEKFRLRIFLASFFSFTLDHILHLDKKETNLEN